MAGQGRRGLSGERDLARLLAGLEPVLADGRYAFSLLDDGKDDAFAVIREDEGVTHVRQDEDGGWARISLTIHSSLDAVGLTAALSAALADAGISANVIAGYYHDHVFVPWDRRREAVAIMTVLAGEAE